VLVITFALAPALLSFIPSAFLFSVCRRKNILFISSFFLVYYHPCLCITVPSSYHHLRHQSEWNLYATPNLRRGASHPFLETEYAEFEKTIQYDTGTEKQN
jgi:hypothetical protein